MSDIHGCYDAFQSMLEQIRFSPEDELILAGDYVDRGKQVRELLHWIRGCPDNVLLLRGNHEEEFTASVDFLDIVRKKELPDSDPSSCRDSLALYRRAFDLAWRAGAYFDTYDTIGILIDEEGFTLAELRGYAAMFREMPLTAAREAGGRKYIVVHAGYPPQEPGSALGRDDPALTHYCLYAREEGYLSGGMPGCTVIAGHTPTIAEGLLTWTGGTVFYYSDEKTDRRFFDIDCGCVFRERDGIGNLACIRLGDEKIFYAYGDGQAEK